MSNLDVESVKNIIEFLLKIFGKDILIVAGNRLKGWVSRLFAGKNVLIFGGKATGKSCLINYLMGGKPFTIDKEGNKATPAPTGMAAVINKKVTLDQSAWYKLQSDFPGDPELRHSWKRGIEDFDPDGIIYMMNGQHFVNDMGIREDTLDKEVGELFSDVLTFYSDSLRNLKAVCVCINFKDLWSHNPATEKMLLRAVRAKVEKSQDTNPIFSKLRFSFHAIQLSSHSTKWDETKQAMAHLGADLME